MFGMFCPLFPNLPISKNVLRIHMKWSPIMKNPVWAKIGTELTLFVGAHEACGRMFVHEGFWKRWCPLTLYRPLLEYVTDFQFTPSPSSNEGDRERLCLIYHRTLHSRCSIRWMDGWMVGEMSEGNKWIMTWPQGTEEEWPSIHGNYQQIALYVEMGFIEKVLNEMRHWFNFFVWSLTLISWFLLFSIDWASFALYLSYFPEG